MALLNKINHEGQYYALYCNFESLQRFTDLERTIPMVTEIIVSSLLNSPIKELSRASKRIPTFDSKFHRGLSIVGGKISDDYFITLTNAISLPLQTLCKILDKPLVIFIDEIDTLSGDVMVSCLSQLREVYIQRDEVPFPSSMALIGKRNICDYKAQIRPDFESLGTSVPFNIITGAFTLSNFSREDVKELYGQHTKETGQAFEDRAVEQAMFWTDGQPWLVNARPMTS
jgi:hypothetical protein